MVEKFKAEDLVVYSRFSNEECKICIVLKRLHTDYDHYYKGSKPVNYFECLIDNKIEAICDVWLRK